MLMTFYPTESPPRLELLRDAGVGRIGYVVAGVAVIDDRSGWSVLVRAMGMPERADFGSSGRQGQVVPPASGAPRLLAMKDATSARRANPSFMRMLET